MTFEKQSLLYDLKIGQTYKVHDCRAVSSAHWVALGYTGTIDRKLRSNCVKSQKLHKNSRTQNTMVLFKRSGLSYGLNRLHFKAGTREIVVLQLVISNDTSWLSLQPQKNTPIVPECNSKPVSLGILRNIFQVTSTGDQKKLLVEAIKEVESLPKALSSPLLPHLNGYLDPALLLRIESTDIVVFLNNYSNPVQNGAFATAQWTDEVFARCSGNSTGKPEIRLTARLDVPTEPEATQKCSEALWRLRGSCGMLTLYDWINAPLRYIQITTFAVNGYFFICLFTRQAVKVNTEGTQVDIYVPFVLIIEFIFHVGWLKVAEENLVPFGRDDDDFSINYLLDRIHHVSFMIVDELHQQRLPAAEDPFMKEECPRLRHTIASYDYRDHVPNWKIGDYIVPQEDQVLLPAFDHFNKPLPEEYKKSLFKQLRRQGNNVVHALHLPVKRDRLNSLP